ncbi:Pentatricopeptide repeat-containing protein [Platanthera guangdongensis]|uniref:Pentatricopeptide repeat-containing protein n=1 Tax=Platanthera guangdongensis TaxID=2320717 RepID=A0ABR2LJP3_9ASPA
MVDMLGRAGRVKEAYEFVFSSRCGGHSVVWGALVGACRVHGDVELARVAVAKFFEMQPDNVGKYVVICNVFAASEMWERAADVWGAIRTLRMKKQLALTHGGNITKIHEPMMFDVYVEAIETHRNSDTVVENTEHHFAHSAAVFSICTTPRRARYLQKLLNSSSSSM